MRLTGNETADRLVKIRSQAPQTLSPTKRPSHTHSSMETGKKKTVDTWHSSTRFGDWGGHSRPLSSACVQGSVVWVPIWRGLAFQTLPYVSVDMLTKPQTHPSALPKICRGMSANMATWCWSGNQAVGLSRQPLPDGWFCGINQTEDLTCMAVNRKMCNVQH